jgi:hypothetical protein
MLKPVTPIDKQVAKENDFQSLNPKWLQLERVMKCEWNRTVKPCPQQLQQRQHRTRPKKILPEKKCQIGFPAGPEKSLSLRWEQSLQGSEDDSQKEKAKSCAEESEWKNHTLMLHRS